MKLKYRRYQSSNRMLSRKHDVMTECPVLFALTPWLHYFINLYCYSPSKHYNPIRKPEQKGRHMNSVSFFIISKHHTYYTKLLMH